MTKILPLERATLYDRLSRPLRDLRLSVTDRCNFRCPYCMPATQFDEHYRFLRSGERLSFEEITRLVRLFVQLGVVKLRLTGGEPLLRPALADLIGDLTVIPELKDVALTTNGVLLAQQAVALRAAGLRRITVSLDSLTPHTFAQMAGGHGNVEDVLCGIEAARTAGLGPIKVNAVIQRGVNDHEAPALVARFRGTGIIVRFIEFMDVGSRNDWQRERVVPSAELLERIRARWPLSPVEANYRGEVARRYALDDGSAEVGFISSVSQPFCGDCSRARLTADGRLFTCLFATQGLDLRTPLRAGAFDEQLLRVLRSAWAARADRYSELRGRAPADQGARVEMNYVGG